MNMSKPRSKAPKMAPKMEPKKFFPPAFYTNLAVNENLSLLLVDKSVPIKVSNQGAYTDGKAIYLPKDITYLKHPAYKSIIHRSLAVHELGHAFGLSHCTDDGI